MDLARPYFSVVGDSISTFQAYSPVGQNTMPRT